MRSGIVMFFGSAILALLPAVAESEGKGSAAYGLLLGCFGAGAIGGALLMPARSRPLVDGRGRLDRDRGAGRTRSR